MITLLLMLLSSPAAQDAPSVTAQLERPENLLPDWDAAEAAVRIDRAERTWTAWTASEPASEMATDAVAVIACGQLLESAVALMASRDYQLAQHGEMDGRRALAICRQLD